MSSPRPGDLGAGFIGLAVAVMFLLGTVLTIVELTNRKFAGHSAAPAAAAPGTAAPAPATTGDSAATAAPAAHTAH